MGLISFMEDVTDFIGINIFRDFGREFNKVAVRAKQQANELVDPAKQQANEVVSCAKQQANEVLDHVIDRAKQRANKVGDRGIKKLILGLLFFVLFLIGAYFGAIFAYQYFFVDVDMEPVQPEEISFGFTGVDHAYFAIKQYIVFAYDQIPCASTLLNTLFGLILPCLFSGLFVFNGHNNDAPGAVDG